MSSLSLAFRDVRWVRKFTLKSSDEHRIGAKYMVPEVDSKIGPPRSILQLTRGRHSSSHGLADILVVRQILLNGW